MLATHHRTIRRTVGFAAALATAAIFTRSAIAASLYYVKASTRVQTGGFGISDPHYNDDNTGQVPALSISSGPFTVTSTGGNYATATAYALSEVGALHGYGSISASSANLAAGGDAQITGSAWGDTITATSNTLPLGTPVSLQATLTFHRTLSGSGSGILVQTSASMTGPFSLSISDSLAAPNSTQSAVDKLHRLRRLPVPCAGLTLLPGQWRRSRRPVCERQHRCIQHCDV